MITAALVSFLAASGVPLSEPGYVYHYAVFTDGQATRRYREHVVFTTDRYAVVQAGDGNFYLEYAGFYFAPCTDPLGTDDQASLSRLWTEGKGAAVTLTSGETITNKGPFRTEVLDEAVTGTVFSESGPDIGVTYRIATGGAHRRAVALEWSDGEEDRLALKVEKGFTETVRDRLIALCPDFAPVPPAEAGP